jgi:hypothetical protein
MILDEVIDQVPEYREFLTVKELDKSSRLLAEEFNTIEMKKIGESGEGRPINYVKIGEGSKNALLFAFPHPNEPIGSMTVEFLTRFFAENPDIVDSLDYTWYFIKAIDPDGAALNEGWFKGDFTPLKYAQNYYRPPGHEQVEWTFPVDYKKLRFSSPPPETKALMKVIDKVKPDFMFSLHNAGFCGVYYYISHPKEKLYTEYSQIVNAQGLPLHKGEPETPFIKKLAPAIFQMFGVQESYDFMLENGVENPQEVIESGTSSYDYLNKVTGRKGFTLVCEMPYFYDKALGDESLTKYDRRQLVLDSIDFSKEAHEFMKERFEMIKDYCDPKHRLYTTIADTVAKFDKRMEPRIHHAKTSPMYEGKATVAQAFDNQVARPYFSSFRVAMTSRLCSIALEPSSSEEEIITEVRNELDLWVEETVENAIKGTDFEVIPISKLVKIQVGSALLTIQNIQ